MGKEPSSIFDGRHTNVSRFIYLFFIYIKGTSNLIGCQNVQTFLIGAGALPLLVGNLYKI